MATAVRVKTPNYDYYYLCTELRKKRTIPVVTKIRAKSAEQFGALVEPAGEEYIFVLKGRVVVTTEFYDPVTLAEGESMYLNSSMGTPISPPMAATRRKSSASCRAPTRS